MAMNQNGRIGLTQIQQTPTNGQPDYSLNPTAAATATTNPIGVGDVRQFVAGGNANIADTSPASSQNTGGGATQPMGFKDSIIAGMSGEKGAQAFLSGVGSMASALGNYFTERMKSQDLKDMQDAKFAHEDAVAKAERDRINARANLNVGSANTGLLNTSVSYGNNTNNIPKP